MKTPHNLVMYQVQYTQMYLNTNNRNLEASRVSRESSVLEGFGVPEVTLVDRVRRADRLPCRRILIMQYKATSMAMLILSNISVMDNKLEYYSTTIYCFPIRFVTIHSTWGRDRAFLKPVCTFLNKIIRILVVDGSSLIASFHHSTSLKIKAFAITSSSIVK